MLDIIKNDKDVHECLCNIFDINVHAQSKGIDNEAGHVKYSKDGVVFAVAGDGSEYIILEDNTVCFHGSEGRVGRIAENINEFFELILNCPYWEDYIEKEKYDNQKNLTDYANQIYEALSYEMKSDGIDLRERQEFLAERLKINLYTNIAENVLIKLYSCSNREQRFYVEYSEDDGEQNISSGTIFNEI